MPRSGTTYFMNLINEVFTQKDGDVIFNGHDYPSGRGKSVGIYRDFRDILVSHWRIRNALYDKNGNITNKMDNSIDSIMKTVKSRLCDLEKFQQNYPEALMIKYEDFWKNPNFIFDELEEFLDIVVPTELREHAINKHTLEKSKKISEGLGEDFDKVDIDTDLHGKHIYTAEPGTWKELISERLHEEVTNKLRIPLEKYGYCTPKRMLSHKERIHDTEGKDLLKRICIGKGIDVGCADRPINSEIDTLDIDPIYNTTFVANILDMPIKDDTYDFLIASHILEHVDNPIDALKEFKRIIKVGGKVGIMVPHGEYVNTEDLGDSAMTHRMLFSEKTLEKYLLHLGFKSVEVNRLERPLASGKVPAIIAFAEK